MCVAGVVVCFLFVVVYVKYWDPNLVSSVGTPASSTHEKREREWYTQHMCGYVQGHP